MPNCAALGSTWLPQSFYIRAIIFVLVISGLGVINLATGAPWWFQWPLLGWAIGVLGHAMAVFSPVRMFGRDSEEKKIKQLMEKP